MWSKYEDQIIKLRSEGKKYREIRDILGCSFTLISYYTIPSEKRRELNRGKWKRLNRQAYESREMYKNRNREFIDNYLRSHPCVDCGNSDIRVLEFDHVTDDKIENISHCANRAWSLERIITEIAKCEVRCCNCHRIKTIERRENKKNKSTETAMFHNN